MTDKNQIEKLVDAGKLDRVGDILEQEPSSHPPKADAPPAADEQSPVAGPDNDGVIDIEIVDNQLERLAALRKEVPPHYISSLPKETKKQREDREKDRNVGIRCALCHGWHHRDAQHVPYVGHAAVTDRLLDVDPFWSWEPVAWTPEGLPRFDASGGMWIRLTIAGTTRLGYGHGASKPHQDPGAREKEVIGDALRNAAMRFGVALDLWHKGELHPDGEGATDEVAEEERDEIAASVDGAPAGTFIDDEQRDRILAMASSAGVEARAICDRYGIEALPQLHADYFDAVMGSLRLTVESKRKDKTAGFGEGGEPAQPNDVLADGTKF